MFLWSMRQYRDDLVKNGYEVFYHSIEDDNFKDKFEDKVLEIIKKKKITTIKFFEIEDHFFETKFNNFISKNNLNCEIMNNPMFLTTRLEFKDFLKSQKKLIRMASFYQKIRQKMSILIDDQNKPLGGKWSYDEDNRKKIPKNIDIPKIPSIQEDKKFKSLKLKINSFFHDHPGSTDYLWMPTNRQESLIWLDNFFKNKFSNFGNYEDAIISENNFLFHSAISPILNMGLLTPDEVIKKALEFSKLKSIPINSLEGFIRQIIGWREFIRGIYVSKGSEERTKNFWGFSRKIPNSFYTGETGIIPIDSTIKKINDYAYCHHIERLMVLGNFMLLCEFDPDEVYKWFMEMFIDSYDWVMVPNVYGMSQFSDGGLMSTKPYISSSNYLFKMSNYNKKDKWIKIWDSLFWRFMDVHRTFFIKNPRMRMLINTYDKMQNDKKTEMRTIAEKYLQSIE